MCASEWVFMYYLLSSSQPSSYTWSQLGFFSRSTETRYLLFKGKAGYLHNYNTSGAGTIRKAQNIVRWKVKSQGRATLIWACKLETGPWLATCTYHPQKQSSVPPGILHLITGSPCCSYRSAGHPQPPCHFQSCWWPQWHLSALQTHMQWAAYYSAGVIFAKGNRWKHEWRQGSASRKNVCVFLLESGTDPNLTDVNHNTALHFAACTYNISLAIELH